ncbi:hypothetical protein [Idiomarina sp.]|uniref:hypothetical protein n=1 Tax=Idiomarina sp. TaxID=1874361 RepID=UPI0025BC68E9|nr:hypothetical protein [Idiomarina sp.]
MSQIIDSLKNCHRNNILEGEKCDIELSIPERWELIREVLNNKKNKILLFMHIPKTGGTTFGERLAEDGVACVLSADADDKTFLEHLFYLIHADQSRPVVVRAHHSLRTFLGSGIDLSNSNKVTLISAYRRPIDVHISNVNMIVERLRLFYKDPKSLPNNVRDFCELWVSRLGVTDVPTGYEVISSSAYIDNAAGLFSNFFNLDSWRELILSRVLKVINYTDFDQIFTEAYGYSKPPSRKNVMSINYLSKDDVDVDTKMRLTSKDEPYSKFIEANLSEAKDICSFV